MKIKAEQPVKPYLKTCVFVFLLLLVSLTSCSSQVKEELPKSKTGTARLPRAQGVFKDASVGCALQDKAGNFWFGTNGEGLYRYNGRTFIHFSEKEGLDSDYIYALLEDKTGTIWIGTRTGLCRYDGTSFAKVSLAQDIQQSFPAQMPTHGRPPLLNGVWSMMQDKKGILWFGTEDGVYCFDPSPTLSPGSKSFTFFLDQVIINTDSLHLKAIFSFLEDKKGDIWMGSCIGEGLIRFDGKTLQRISPKGYARTQGLSEGRDGNIWFASIGKGLCRYDGKTITTNFLKEKNTYDLLYILLKDQQDHFWFSEPSNNRPLCYYDGNESCNFTEVTPAPNKKMFPVLEDKMGNTWFSAEGMNLYRFDGKIFTCLSE